jgi:hypothetical protein
MVKRTAITLLVLALLATGSTALLAQSYDSAKSVAVMRSNLQAMRGLRGQIESGDFLAAAAAFAVLAQGSRTLLEMDPPKGSEAEWDRINSDLVDAALEGIVAAGAKDAGAASAALGKIGALNKEGHSNFQ